MPTYEYACAKCGAQIEVFQSITEKPLTVCPKDKCPQKRWGKGKIKRQLSGGAGLLFKGSGFYITDYRSEGYKQAAKKETAPPAASTSDSKPAAKTGDSKPSHAKTESKPAKPGGAAKS